MGEPIDQLAVEIDALPHDLRPGRVHDLAGELIASATRERLFEPAAWPAQPTCALAVRAKSYDRLRRWVIDIDPDAAWSDGSPISAGDAVRAIQYLTDAPKVAPLGWLADVVTGCRARRLGAQARSGAIGCVARGRHRIELTLERPVANLPTLLTSTAFSPVAPDSQLASGPYELGATLPRDRGFVLTANPIARSWRHGAPRRVALLRTDSPEQGIELYRRGSLHVTAGTWFPHARLAHQCGRPDLHVADLALAAYVLPNPRRVTTLADPRARRALSLAIDRRGTAAAVHGVIAPLWRFTEMWGGEVAPPERDPGAASALMLSLHPRLPAQIRLAYADFPPNGDVVAALAADVHDAIGVELVPVPLSYLEQRYALATGDFELMYCLSLAPFPDPSSLLAPFIGGALGFADPGFDAAVATAEAEPDAAARLLACERANDILLDSLPVVPIARVRNVCLCRPELSGFVVRPDGTVPFQSIRLPDPAERAL